MLHTTKNQQPETTGLHTFLKAQDRMTLDERCQLFAAFVKSAKENHQHSYYRTVSSPADREVNIVDAYTGKLRKMTMFASNNYLGLANHPHVRKRVLDAIEKYGVGVGGPPLLNGYTALMQELEERLADFKHQEAAIIFPSGFSANLGLIAGLAQRGDHVICDDLSHASFVDGLHLTEATSDHFAHNDMAALEAKLMDSQGKYNNVFVGVEGVYSMDGDMAPLDKVVALCKKYGAYCWLDDAHGNGVMGPDGSGTAAHFGLSKDIDVSMGTFSKAFAATGGFLTGSRETIDYLRFFARSYMFSAALTPMVLAAVLGGMEVIEKEPELRVRLFDNSQYAQQKLQHLGFAAQPEAAIIALKVPEWMDIRKANYKVHQQGIFLNAIEYPAVPVGEERFRVSLMANHTHADIDKLASCLEEVWQDRSCTRDNIN